jgi:hypothetical protein
MCEALGLIPSMAKKKEEEEKEKKEEEKKEKETICKTRIMIVQF